MNCSKCGFQLTGEDQFCKNCGAAVTAQIENGGQVFQQQPVPQTGIVSEPTMNPQNIAQAPINTQQYQQPSKKNDNIKIIVIGLVAIAAIIAGTLIFLSMNKKEEKKPDATVVSTKVYKVNFSGFTFSIPDDLIYQATTNMLAIGDENANWMAKLEIEQGSFSQLEANKNQLHTVLQKNGYTSTVAVDKKIGDVKFLTMEMSKGGQKGIAALTKLNSMYFAAVTALSQDNEYDYKILEKIAPIIASAELIQETSNMEINSALDISSFAELAK